MPLSRLTLFSAGLLSLGLFATSTVAQDAPLLMDGKDTLFQRILIRDRVSGRDAPDGTKGDTLAPLKPFYVYQRQDEWLQVGPYEDGRNLSWIPSKAAVDWNQNIVATFEGSENLGRLLFFRDLDPVYDMLELENPGPQAQEYRQEAEAAETGGEPSETVVALGPREVIDQRSNLYVMPILDFEEEVFDSGAFVNLLRVAVARAQPGADPAEGGDTIPRSDTPRATGSDDEYRLGVVFVVDTTMSMEPYIRATQQALSQVYQTIEDAGVADTVSFGLVGYRDNISAAPGLDYDVQTFVTLKEGLESGAFLNGIAQMSEARSSSRNFREDSYAGILSAGASMDWTPYSGRFIILVTDASPREANDELSATGIGSETLNAVIREELGAAIGVMHLKTPGGANDHSRAEAAYRKLSSYPNQPPFYFPIKNGDPALFRDAALDLGNLLASDAQKFRSNPEAPRADGDRAIPEEDAPTTRFSGIVSAGRTMQLAFLGRTEGTSAPDVFEAYVADRDFDRTGLKPLSIRLLITKAQLSALYDALSIIIEKGEENIIDPDQFFDQVLGAAADMSRNPEKVSRRADTTLAQAVAIDEYIKDLPYRSRIMTLTQEDWLDMSFSQQAAVINDLYDKITRYKRYNEATDLWVDYLGTGAEAENLLYPMPLDDLP